MRPLKALIIVLLFLTVLALVPVGAEGGYRFGVVTLRVRLGLISVRVFPRKKKAGEPRLKKPKKPKKTRKQKKREAPAEDAAEKKKPFDKKQLFALVKIGLKALGRFKRKLRVDYLRLHYTFASGDPFKTAMGFGASSAAMNTLVPLIDGAFIIKQRDIGTSFDFLSDKPSYDCWITLSIQVWELVYIGSALGLDFLKLKLKQRRENRKRKE